MNYTPEELLPLVSDLTERYTEGESTSVTWETARRLMEAVLYCIHEYETEYEMESLSQAGRLPVSGAAADAGTAYERGYRAVSEKTSRAQELYGTVLSSFHSYENIACRETVEAGLTAFFLRYDPKFAPQDHLLTLDYPLLRPLPPELCGVDAIWEYLCAIRLEQKFLSRFPEEFVLRTLEVSCPGYRGMFLNLCEPVLRRCLACMAIGVPAKGAPFASGERDALARWVGSASPSGLREKLYALLGSLLDALFPGDEELSDYLGAGLKDFAAGLHNAAEQKNMHLFLP